MEEDEPDPKENMECLEVIYARVLAKIEGILESRKRAKSKDDPNTLTYLDLSSN